ncbi:MAG TPA: zinc-binding alcohol dehydrogenase family protein [Streptosporangiaceae bacterium]|nr:zinc-binding alcohol dehydrogenase family protein [Streptosporangiaceae bacterium]
MKAAVLHAFGQVPRWEETPAPVPADGEELVQVTAAPLNNIDKVRADGSHYSVRSGGDSGGLPAVSGVIGAGLLGDGQRVLFGSRCGTMAQYSVASRPMTFPIPGGLDDAVAAAAWNPGMSAWLAFGWRCPIEPGQSVLVLGATGVTGKLAVQAARHFGAGRVVAAGRNEQVLATLADLGADATIQLAQPDQDLAAAFAAQGGAQGGELGYDVVVDYLWGHPTEVFLSCIEHHDAVPRSGRVRLLHAGEMAGSVVALPGSVLRSAGLEVLGLGTGTMPPMDVITGMLGEILGLLADGKLRIDVERVPLSSVGEVWARDQRGRRPVFIP